MKINILILLALFSLGLVSCKTQTSEENNQTPVERPDWVIVVHGGAGNITPERIPPEKEADYKAKLTEALEAGATILDAGGSSLDAVEVAINILEDCPLFNAGKGAVFSADGINELDASIMDGNTMNAGAVASVTTIRHPISAARVVMEKSAHVMLVKEGAEQFAEEQGLEIVDPSWFYTEDRWESLQKAKQRETEKKENLSKRSGTVGCVALDRNGNLAAGTSTGGMTNKKYGRVGDSPIIGAGTYANNNSCAVSATGHGEYFIRNVVAHDISARMLYAGMTLNEASDEVINHILKDQEGSGGIIAIDKNGNISMPFNTSGMFRGYMKPGAEVEVFIFIANDSH
jgi:beta-aspartyl-peptidase (threonine type)